MKTFEIRYYISDHGGMRDELDRVEHFEGTYEEAVEKVENTNTGWGFNYRVIPVEEYHGHGCATIVEVNKRVPELIAEIERLQKELETLR